MVMDMAFTFLIASQNDLDDVMQGIDL